MGKDKVGIYFSLNASLNNSDDSSIMICDEYSPSSLFPIFFQPSNPSHSIPIHYTNRIAPHQKYSIMSQLHKGRLSVNHLLTLLENPRTRTSVKRNQPILDRQQIRRQMVMKWKDPGFCSIQFSKAPSMRGEILNEWQLERIALAERSYVTPKESKPYHFDREAREFPKVGLRSYPKKFQRYLKQVEAQKQDLLFKEKRTITQGISLFHSIAKENADKTNAFKPTSTSSKIFGFSNSNPNSKSFSSKPRNKHFKTLNL